MSEYQSKNRRNGMERRQHFVTPKFPFYDSSGHLVAHDRRILPDRRPTGITVEWINEEEITAEVPNLSAVTKNILSAY